MCRVSNTLCRGESGVRALPRDKTKPIYKGGKKITNVFVNPNTWENANWKCKSKEHISYYHYKKEVRGYTKTPDPGICLA